MSGPDPAAEPILTPAQEGILKIFAASPLSKSFYFGGASALSAVYFQHRLSEDLDFFRGSEFTVRQLTSFETQLTKHHFKLQRGKRLPVYIYHVSCPDGSTTKLDFSYYPYDRIDRGTRWRGIDVDSVLDMAVNKIRVFRHSCGLRDRGRVFRNGRGSHCGSSGGCRTLVRCT